jgi:hypothetical protein
MSNEVFELGNGNFAQVDPAGGVTIYNDDNIVPLNARQVSALHVVLSSALCFSNDASGEPTASPSSRSSR